MTVFADNPALDSAWYVVAESPDLTDTPVAVTLLTRPIVLWRGPDNVVVAAPDRCPHREAPLSIGTVSNGTLTCCYHGWQFGVQGRCSAVPSARPGTPVPPAANLEALRCEERYGLVWVCPGRPAAEVPTIMQDSDPSFRRINTGMETWAVSATRMADNFMDIAHFPWVHTGTFGAGQDRVVPKLELTQLDADWYGYQYEVDANNPAEATATSGSDDDVVHRHMTTGFSLPFNVRSTIRYHDGLEHILLLATTPVDDLTSLFTFVVWRNDDFSVDPNEIIAFDRAIGAEDKLMLEQVPGVLALERTGVANVAADKPSVEWRRQLAAMLG